MATDAPMAMPTDAQILTLGQWLSPAYPIGAFTNSHGLEGAVAEGMVSSAEDLTRWLTDVLQAGAGRTDATFLAAAFQARSDTELSEIDTLCRALAPSRERLLELTAQGAAFCKITNAVWVTDLPDLTYPVAVGAAASRIGLPQTLTAGMYLQAFVSNLVAAAQRLLPVGQTSGQKILMNMAPEIRAIAQDTGDGDLARLSSTTFLADMAAMKHETQYSRIFRT